MKKTNPFDIDYRTPEGKRYLKQFYNIIVQDGVYYRKCTKCNSYKEFPKYFTCYNPITHDYSRYCTSCTREEDITKFLDRLSNHHDIEETEVATNNVTNENTSKDLKKVTTRSESSRNYTSTCKNSPLWFLALIGLRGLYDQGMSEEDILSLLCKLGLDSNLRNLKEYKLIIDSSELFFPNVRYYFHIKTIMQDGRKLLKATS
jgi:hypothetical protein